MVYFLVEVVIIQYIQEWTMSLETTSAFLSFNSDCFWLCFLSPFLLDRVYPTPSSSKVFNWLVFQVIMEGVIVTGIMMRFQLCSFSHALFWWRHEMKLSLLISLWWWFLMIVLRWWCCEDEWLPDYFLNLFLPSLNECTVARQSIKKSFGFSRITHYTNQSLLIMIIYIHHICISSRVFKTCYATTSASYSRKKCWVGLIPEGDTISSWGVVSEQTKGLYLLFSLIFPSRLRKNDYRNYNYNTRKDYKRLGFVTTKK